MHALTSIAEDDRRALAERARHRVLTEHTAEHRAVQLEGYFAEARGAIPRGGDGKCAFTVIAPSA